MLFSPTYKECVLSVSFSNYLKNKSGMPKVVMAHQKMFNEEKISYIYLFSVKKMVFHEHGMLFCLFGVIIDGKYMGVYPIHKIIKEIGCLIEQGQEIHGIHIHHLLYIKLKYIKMILDAFQNIPIVYYLHDYYCVCTNYTLRKNKDVYCGGEGLNSQCCKNCNSHKNSIKIENKIGKLFSKYKDRLTFVSPSEATKEIFLRFRPEYQNQVIVIPHQKLIEVYKENMNPIERGKKIKIGFLGMPSKHKGWETWCKLVQQSDANNYEYYVFNSSNKSYSNMHKEYVAFNEKNLDAMTQALRKNNIDIILMWALWPETYSYTYYEAYSSNAYVLTNTISGNIMNAVQENGNGLVLEDEEALLSLFMNSKQMTEYVNKFRESRKCGPLFLEENSYIVEYTKKEKKEVRYQKQMYVNLYETIISGLLNRFNVTDNS